MIDIALAFYLVFILPGLQLWRSARPTDGPKRPRALRYLSTIREIALLLLVLAAVCWWGGHAPSALGLAAPVSAAARWSLAAAAAVVPVLYFVGKLMEHTMDPAKRAAAEEQILASDRFPRTPAELRLFVVLSLFVGIGWELLYRGFLMLALAPLIGTWGAVVLAAVAYGAAHGYENPRQLANSIASALLFTVGYVLTGSLWWLMLIHIAIPLSIPLYYYKMMRDQKVHP